RSKVEAVGAQTDDLAAQTIEGVAQQEQFAGGVYVGPLPAAAVEGVTDLDPIDRRDNVVVAGGANDLTGAVVADDPGQHCAVALARHRFLDVALDLVRCRYRREPELPELAVGGRGDEVIGGRLTQRLEQYAVPSQRHRNGMDHRVILFRLTASRTAVPERRLRE